MISRLTLFSPNTNELVYAPFVVMNELAAFPLNPKNSEPSLGSSFSQFANQATYSPRLQVLDQP